MTDKNYSHASTGDKNNCHISSVDKNCCHISTSDIEIIVTKVRVIKIVTHSSQTECFVVLLLITVT